MKHPLNQDTAWRCWTSSREPGSRSPSSRATSPSARSATSSTASCTGKDDGQKRLTIGFVIPSSSRNLGSIFLTINAQVSGGGPQRRRFFRARGPLRPHRHRRPRRPDRSVLCPDAQRLHRPGTRKGRQSSR